MQSTHLAAARSPQPTLTVCVQGGQSDGCGLCRAQAYSTGPRALREPLLQRKGYASFRSTGPLLAAPLAGPLLRNDG
jgi:hypothetical protein